MLKGHCSDPMDGEVLSKLGRLSCSEKVLQSTAVLNARRCDPSVFLAIKAAVHFSSQSLLGCVSLSAS